MAPAAPQRSKTPAASPETQPAMLVQTSRTTARCTWTLPAQSSSSTGMPPFRSSRINKTSIHQEHNMRNRILTNTIRTTSLAIVWLVSTLVLAANGQQPGSVELNALAKVTDGRKIFRYDTFGDQ